MKIGLIMTFALACLAGCAEQPAPQPAKPSGLPVVEAVPEKRAITIAWGGDVTPGSQYGNPPESGRGLLAAPAKRLQAADIAAVNLEGTLGSGGQSKCGAATANCFAFQAPRANAVALTAAGVDVVNLANNHSNDFGVSGLRQTRKALTRRSIKYSGLPGQIAYLRRHRQTVAFVGFASYRWTAPLNNLRAAKRLVAKASRRADLVVVFMHGGAEGSDKTRVPYGPEFAFGENRGQLRKFTRAMVAAGADLVVGSGPHVLRGVEVYRGRVIAYSLANLAGYHNFGTGGASSLSGILSVTLKPSGSARSARFLSLRLGQDNIPIIDRHRAAARLVSQLSRSDFGHRGVKITSSGRVILP